jgi:deazaflavin-dependent oxidoreductase (nitroreductase family)
LPNIRWLLASITTFHLGLFRYSRGRLGHRFAGKRFLILTHVGRRSGVEHEVPLLYADYAGRWVVAASNMGDANDPHWWRNLAKNPEARIQIGTEHIPVRARRAEPRECDTLWRLLEASYRFYPNYRERAGREIPVVVLERRDPVVSP